MSNTPDRGPSLLNSSHSSSQHLSDLMDELVKAKIRTIERSIPAYVMMNDEAIGKLRSMPEIKYTPPTEKDFQIRSYYDFGIPIIRNNFALANFSDCEAPKPQPVHKTMPYGPSWAVIPAAIAVIATALFALAAR